MKLLVPMDGSDNALRALDYAVSTQALYRDPVEIHLLNVQRPIVSGAVKSFISAEQLHDYYQDEGAAALARGRERMAGSGIVHSAHVAIGEEPVAIGAYAESHHCDLIVMGTRGLGNMANLLLGSVAARVIHLASVPVLLIK